MDLPGRINPAPKEFLAHFATPAPVTPLPIYDATPDPSLASLKELDLREHLAKFEGLVFNNKGFCLCPVHAEKDPSFEVKQHTDGHWYWFDWHNQGREGFSGTIIDYYVTIKKMSVGEAIRTIRERQGIRETTITPVLTPLTAATNHKAFVGSLQNFFIADIPESEALIEGLLRREEFLYVGGVKHSHKTSLVMGLGLYYAAGKSPWLIFKIPKPGRFLIVQQELGEAEFRKRLQAAVTYGGFDLSVLDRFFPFTGTGDPIKVHTDSGFARLESLIKQFQPDILALDPQAAFCSGGENDDKIQAGFRDRINYLKTQYKIGVVLSHHFSSKRPAGSPLAPTELGGWFRGHTVLSDAADAQIGLHRLPGQRDNPNLPQAYENYNQVEITLRNGKWPPRFAIEFDEASFLMHLTDVWKEMGMRIPVGDVREVCDAHGGSILLAELIRYYETRLGGVSPHTVKKAVEREVEAGYIVTERLPGKGKPILVKSQAVDGSMS